MLFGSKNTLFEISILVELKVLNVKIKLYIGERQDHERRLTGIPKIPFNLSG